MLSELTNKIVTAVKSFGKGKPTENQVDTILRNIRIALLESDVSLTVVKNLISSLKKKIDNKISDFGIVESEFIIESLHDEILMLLGGYEAVKNKYKKRKTSRNYVEQSSENEILEELDTENTKKTKIKHHPLNQISNFNKDLEDIVDKFSLASSDIKNEVEIPISKTENGSTPIIMMLGLQGSGKTTTTAKLAYYLSKTFNKKILVVCLDVYRPAAYKQLSILSKSGGYELIGNNDTNDINSILQEYFEFTEKNKYDFIIFDTAGRTVSDNKMMLELKNIYDTVHPTECLLVMDSLSGQSTVGVAQEFNSIIKLDGFILTRIDSDTRGGAALSLKACLNLPIKFIANGEKIEDLEIFNPERIASVIVGRGDIENIVKKTKENFKNINTEKLQKGRTDFNEILLQLQGIKKMGNFKGIASMLPAMSGITNKINQFDDNGEIDRMISIIKSMTKKERIYPPLVITSKTRRRRICIGSGRNNRDFDKLIKFYQKTKELISKISNMKDKSSMNKIINNLFKN
ncbi:signal recognition particle receptor subunit alpha [Lyticum sinuosum]|uniref:signal-recognition-particle GTPase n=1 Tax=Lyticum sinuosum TaxID=1332059 RepID=A0AAE4VJC7_9RICK|nr:signal recognition particle receptor subunit alpha [Lyticum sinuosum]MDZ5760851.1 Signal recognition particle protein [Lyticum sinuosum]